MHANLDTSFKDTAPPETEPYFKPHSPCWYRIDWNMAISKHYPVLKLKTEDTLNESILFRAVQIMADETGHNFEDAAIWVLHRALDTRLKDARKMVLDEMPWGTEILHICRVMAMFVCKRYYSAKRQSLRKVDDMIWPLLITGDGFRPRVVPLGHIRRKH